MGILKVLSRVWGRWEFGMGLCGERGGGDGWGGGMGGAVKHVRCEKVWWYLVNTGVDMIISNIEIIPMGKGES